MASDSHLQEQLDEIYGGDPGDFTKRRDELAKSLKSDGGSDLAAAVKKLKRPTQAASVINRLSLGDTGAISPVLEAGAELRQAQAQLGKPGTGERLKAASTAQREAIAAALTAAAEQLGASGATLDRISETLHATAGDEALAETVGAGRLEREGQAAGLGGPIVVPPPGAAGKRKTAKEKKPAPAPKRDDGSARKRRSAERKLEQAEAKLQDAESKEAEARDRVGEIERELRVAQTTLDGAGKAADRARESADRARAALDDLAD